MIEFGPLGRHLGENDKLGSQKGNAWSKLRWEWAWDTHGRGCGERVMRTWVWRTRCGKGNGVQAVVQQVVAKKGMATRLWQKGWGNRVGAKQAVAKQAVVNGLWQLDYG